MIGTRLTIAGAIILARAIAGSTLQFTRGAFGDAIRDGERVIPSDRDQDNFTTLIHERMSLPITAFKVDQDKAIVSLLVNNDGVEESFTIAEGGLYATDPTTDSEVLYAYFYQGDDGGTMYAGGGAVQFEYSCELVTTIANAPNVTAVLQRIFNGITSEEFEAHINSDNPHPNLDAVNHTEFNTHVDSDNPHPNLDAVNHTEFNTHVDSDNPHPNLDVVNHTEFNTHVDSDNPHPNWKVKIYPGAGLNRIEDTLNVVAASADSIGGIKVGKGLYMDGDSLNANTEVLDSRISQLEINQSNLYLRLDADYSLGMTANLLLVEDFINVDCTDTFQSNFYSLSDKKYLRVYEVNGLRVGGFYNLTDGLLANESVQITALADTGYYVPTYLATVKEPFNNSYDATFYRSTVTLKDNKAYGAGDVRTHIYVSDITWQGESSGEEFNLTFNTTPANEPNLILEGDYSLTSDGFFTLD